MRVAAIVLAAGASSRMGRPKMTLPYGDSTVLGAVIDAVVAGGVDKITVVLGWDAEEVKSAIGNWNVSVCINPNPERGMASSVQAALLQVAEEFDAYLIVLGDQPQIQASTVELVTGAALRSTKGIVVPTFGGKRGHPVLFRMKYKNAILALPEEVGLNAVRKQNADDVLELPVDTETTLKDIDTPEDYREAIGQ